MSPIGWSGVASTTFCLGASTLLLLRERRVAEIDKSQRGDWLRRWVLARVLLLVAGLSVLGVWVLK
jgi:hypothetical protein